MTTTTKTARLCALIASIVLAGIGQAQQVPLPKKPPTAIARLAKERPRFGPYSGKMPTFGHHQCFRVSAKSSHRPYYILILKASKDRDAPRLSWNVHC